MKSVIWVVLIGIFVFVFDSFVAMAQQHPSDLSILFTCIKSPGSCWRTIYRPVPGDTLTLWIRVLNPDRHQSSSLTVTLRDKSKHVGDYMNSWNNNREYDMKFQYLSVHRQNNESRLQWEKGSHLFSGLRGGLESLTVRWDNSPPGWIKVFIDISDGAAYANFSAALYNHPSYNLTIPYDASPRNEIADSFDRRYSDADRSGHGDNETGPGSNPHHGDGFSYFEEYRGVSIKGAWQSLSPLEKDVFVCSDFDGPPKTGPRSGTKGYVERTLSPPIDAEPEGFASNLPSPFRVHVVNKSDTLNRKINYRDTGHRRITQEAVAIEERPFAREQDAIAWILDNYDHDTGEVLGVAEEKSLLYAWPNAPGAMKPCLIFTVFLFRPSITRKADQLNNTIGHEFGHCISLKHSGSSTDIMAHPNVVKAYPSASYTNKYTDSRHEQNYCLIPHYRSIGDVFGFQELTELPGGSDSGGSDCPSHELPPTGPTTRSSVSAPVWRPGATNYQTQYLYESDRDYRTNWRIEYSLNLSYLTDYAVPTHANRYHNHDGFLCGDPDANGFSVVSVSPSHETSTGDYIISPGIVEVEGDMRLRILVGYFQCGVWTFVIRARNDSGYADVTYTVELRDWP